MSSGRNPMKGFRPAEPHTNRRGGYQKGLHLEVCDRSGKIYDSDKIRKEWNGLSVGADEWEPRHPQEFRRGIRENIAVKDARPQAALSADLSSTLSDVTAISGSVAGGTYTSGSADETRPFVYWTLDLGASYDLAYATLSGLYIDGNPPPAIRNGIYLGWSTDGSTYANLTPALGKFEGGVALAAASYAVPIDQTARYLRLALIDGKGLGYAGVLVQTGLTATRNA